MLSGGWGQVIKLLAWTDPVFSGGTGGKGRKKQGNGERHLYEGVWTGYGVHAPLLRGFDPCLSKLSRCPLPPMAAAVLRAVMTCWDSGPSESWKLRQTETRAEMSQTGAGGRGGRRRWAQDPHRHWYLGQPFAASLLLCPSPWRDVPKPPAASTAREAGEAAISPAALLPC